MRTLDRDWSLVELVEAAARCCQRERAIDTRSIASRSSRRRAASSGQRRSRPLPGDSERRRRRRVFPSRGTHPASAAAGLASTLPAPTLLCRERLRRTHLGDAAGSTRVRTFAEVTTCSLPWASTFLSSERVASCCLPARRPASARWTWATSSVGDRSDGTTRPRRAHAQIWPSRPYRMRRVTSVARELPSAHDVWYVHHRR